MSKKMTAKQIETAIQDPGSVFRTPEEVARHPDLSREQKKKILASWETDEKLLLTAEAENMEPADRPGEGAGVLQRIVGLRTTMEE